MDTNTRLGWNAARTGLVAGLMTGMFIGGALGRAEMFSTNLLGAFALASLGSLGVHGLYVQDLFKAARAVGEREEP